MNSHNLNENEINYIKDNLEYYEACLHRSKPNHRFCFGRNNSYLEASNYEKFDEYIRKELNISDLAKKNLLDYYEKYIVVM
ncbi:unnamed protein product [Brachionus calyciflorus]|uniref:Uncharacterized protein n=1 Tax=Brachionus calyciflorus TaxID=104777 RepID=A0A813QYW1_9BILA|nr:unnamed protein product [Brachionus calyciflorus]